MNVREWYLSVKGIRTLVETERETWSYLSEPPRRRLQCWRNGFLSRSGVLYDLDEKGYEPYVTDYQRFVRSKRINGTWSVVLSNKLIFHWMMQPFEDHRTGIYGMIRNGRFLPVDTLQPTSNLVTAESGPNPAIAAVAEREAGAPQDDRTQNSNSRDTHDRNTSSGDVRERDAAARVIDRLEADGRLVLKWIQGGGGNNVLLCSNEADGYRVNGEHLSEAEFAAMVDDLDEYLVCEFVEQGSFPAAFYPDTPNTIRLITMYDEDAGEPFVPIAIQRIGTEASYPMDNFSQGGLTAEIDVETGELGRGVQLPYSGEREWYEFHPDTGTPIEGVSVPGWSRIRDRVLDLADAFSFVPYVGWDVIVTDDEGGFAVVEGNSYPGLKSMQVHRPLLADDRTRQFYERHGVV